MILISTQCFPPSIGGIERVVYAIARGMAENNQNVIVYADKNNHPETDKFDEKQIFSIKRYGGLKPLRRRIKAQQLTRYAQQNEIEAIFTDSWKSLEHLALPTGIPVLCLAHGMEYPINADQAKNKRLSKSLNKATYVIANSDYTADRVKPFCQNGQQIKMITPGIDEPARLMEDVFNEVNNRYADHTPVLISIGRLVRHKGHAQLINAIKRLTPDYPDLLYHVIGDGPEKTNLQQLARQLDLASNIIFHGQIEDEQQKNTLLSVSDVFVLPGYEEGNNVEGFGIVFIEAAWFGLPALAGLSGGAATAVVDKQTGLLCQGDNDQDVYSKLKQLLDDKGLRKQLGDQARIRAKEFLWPNIIKQYLSLLKIT